jgi:hypothetical protein
VWFRTIRQAAMSPSRNGRPTNCSKSRTMRRVWSRLNNARAILKAESDEKSRKKAEFTLW